MVTLFDTKSDQTFSQGLIKTQHNLTTSRSQMYMGAKPPYPVESTTVTGSNTVSTQHESLLKYWTETCAHKFYENTHSVDVQGEQFDVWDMNSDIITY